MTDIETGVNAAVQDAFTRAFTNFKGTFSFERKVNLGNYESATAAVFVQFDYAPDATPEEFLGAAREAALQAKSIVFEQLGREAHVSDGVVMEVIQENFPGSTVEAVSPDPQDRSAGRQAAASAAVGPNPPYSKDEVDNESDSDEKKRMRKENAVWAKARYETHPQEFYDNRQKKAEEGWTSPDFTHKKSKAGFYEN